MYKNKHLNVVLKQITHKYGKNKYGKSKRISFQTALVL